jgi:hypothetical protein
MEFFMRIALPVLFSALLLTACAEDKQAIVKSTPKEIDTPVNSSGNQIPKPDQTTKYLYEYADSSDEGLEKMILAVKWLNDSTIEFDLDTKTTLCDTRFYGIAKNPYDMDPEILEPNGEGLAANQYIKEESEYWLNIKITYDKEFAVIDFIDRTAGTDCVPMKGMVMKKR